MNTKKTLLFALIWGSTSVLFGQVGINPSGAEPHPSAGLDVDFSNRGLLPPRMTTSERDAIANPAEGLQIFNTSNKCLEHFVNGIWQAISCACSIPDVTSTTPGSRCGTGSVSVSATASAGTINWYDSPSGGMLLGTGPALNTPSISSTTSYYAEAVNGSCISASRAEVVATVNEYPAVSSITGTSTITVPQTTQLSCSTPGGIWSSSNTGVATVSGTGMVTAVSEGSVTISYSVTSNGCTASSTLGMTINPQDPCDALGGMMYAGSCWLPTGVRATDAEISCSTFCTGLGKTCDATVMQGISQSQATEIVHLFHPGVVTNSNGDAPAYSWTAGTGSYYVEANTCPHNDNVTGRERYCVCTPWP
jgi:hypothetical protein